MGFVFLLSVMTVAYLLESSSADQRLDDGSFDSSLLQDLDQLVIPASTLLGIPQDQDENFTTNEGVLRSALEKRSGRRFRTSAG
ncbi:hypothetical protein SK128_022736 [Halocaridina rubra]|uniref:Uncharacterized protein n=1 Tax=Halocaridina rubra TaxID=373956 RepID=A0AAN8ZX75_HALRR